MKAVSAAFDGAEVWAVDGFWDIKIATIPPKTLILSAGWVENNIQPVGSAPIGITPAELQANLKRMAATDWRREADGNLTALLRHDGR
jgi:hypothetical protein